MLAAILSLLLVLAAVAAILSLVTVWVMARALLQPPRMTDGKAAYWLHRLSPGDLGLGYEVMDFNVRDDATGQPLRLAAWWIPQARSDGRCVVLLHGFADAKVGAIAWAPTLHGLGFNILALDLRAHGESDGRWCTGGYFERHDVNQVIDDLRRRLPEETRQIVLFGISLGAAVALAAAVQRDDVSAVVLESPFDDFGVAAMSHARASGMPGPMFQRAALRLAERRSGADFSAVRPVDLIPRLRAPLMILGSGADIFVSAAQTAAIRAAAAARPAEMGPTVYWEIEGAAHVQGICLDPELYARRVGDFLASAVLDTRPQAGPLNY